MLPDNADARVLGEAILAGEMGPKEGRKFSLDELANLLADLNEPEDRGPCLAAFQELLALRAKSLGPGHPDTQKTQIELATAVAQFDRCGFNNTAGGDE